MTDTSFNGTAVHGLTAGGAASGAAFGATVASPADTGGIPSPDRTADRFADVERATQTLLEELHRLGPGDRRRERLWAEIIALNTTSVRSIARRYAGRGEPLEDLEQVAFMGLVQAVNRFNPTRGVRFWGYAYPVVVGEVRRHFRDNTWGVRVSRRLQELRTLLERAVAEFTAAHGRPPTTAELADRVGIGQEETVEAVLAAEAYRPLSLDAAHGGPADHGTVGENLGVHDPGLDEIVDGYALRTLLARLPERERTIVLLRFFGNQTQSQIAAQLGVSQMHISRLLAQILRQLRHALLAGT